jgi:hypothetical protein
MDELLRLLQEFETNTEILYDEDEYISDSNIAATASAILIDEEGNCNWENIHTLETNGFSVIPIEKDSFGWLIGGIVTKKGILTYG